MTECKNNYCPLRKDCVRAIESGKINSKSEFQYNYETQSCKHFIQRKDFFHEIEKELEKK